MVAPAGRATSGMLVLAKTALPPPRDRSFRHRSARREKSMGAGAGVPKPKQEASRLIGPRKRSEDDKIMRVAKTWTTRAQATP